MGFLDVVSTRIDGLGHHPDKNKINAISATARDVLAGNVAGVGPEDLLGLILKKIYRADSRAKVPLWYLTDSILYNVGGDYIKHVQKELPLLFKDSYYNVSQDDKKRLDRLLYRWEQRQRFIHKDVLHETRARLHPDFKQAEYREYVRSKKQKLQRAAKPQPLLPASLPPPQPLAQLPEQFTVDEAEYWKEVEQTTSRLLKDMQKDVSEENQLTLPLIKQMNPELYEVLLSNAQQELNARGIHCRNPTFLSTGSVNQTEVNWDIKYLRSGSGVPRILDDLFCIGLGRESVHDEVTGLTFTDVNNKLNYHSKYVVSSINTLEEIRAEQDPFYEEEQLCREGRRARAFLQPLEHWLEVGEEFQQEYSVIRTDNEVIEEEKVEEPVSKVVADDSFPTCALTGEKFNREFDQDRNEWVYLNAIRPVADGPIYLATAYAQTQMEEPASKRPKTS